MAGDSKPKSNLPKARVTRQIRASEGAQKPPKLPPPRPTRPIKKDG